MCFESGLINSLDISPFIEIDPEKKWNREGLEELAEKRRLWFLEKTGISAPVEFPWGSIEITADAKSWSAPIVVTYQAKDLARPLTVRGEQRGLY